MVQYIRAEDLIIGEDFLDLGGRMVTGSSILSSHVQKRISAELLGCGVILAIGGFLLIQPIPIAARILMALVMLGLSAGGLREIRRAYVLVLQLYQIGGFEVRGFTQSEIVIVAEALADLRGVSAPPWNASALSSE